MPGEVPEPGAVSPDAQRAPVAGGPGVPTPSSGSPAALLPPPAIPDYTVLRRIGGGAYGEVWLAR